MKKVIVSGVSLAVALTATVAFAAWDQNEADELVGKAQVALTAFIEKDDSVQVSVDTSPGFVVIPTVGKGGIGIWGARGKGLLYEDGEATAIITLTQLSIGL